MRGKLRGERPTVKIPAHHDFDDMIEDIGERAAHEESDGVRSEEGRVAQPEPKRAVAATAGAAAGLE